MKDTRKSGMEKKKAIQEFLKNNKNYKYFLIDKSDNRQPDVYLKKIR